MKKSILNYENGSITISPEIVIKPDVTVQDFLYQIKNTKFGCWKGTIKNRSFYIDVDQVHYNFFFWKGVLANVRVSMVLGHRLPDDVNIRSLKELFGDEITDEKRIFAWGKVLLGCDWHDGYHSVFVEYHDIDESVEQESDKKASLNWVEPVDVTHAVFSSWRVLLLESIKASIAFLTIFTFIFFSLIIFFLLSWKLEGVHGKWIAYSIGLLLCFYGLYYIFLSCLAKIQYKNGRHIVVNNEYITCGGIKWKWIYLHDFQVKELLINGRQYVIFTASSRKKRHAYAWGIDCNKINVHELLNTIFLY